MNDDKYKMRKRDVALDCLKGFAIFLVLLGIWIKIMDYPGFLEIVALILPLIAVVVVIFSVIDDHLKK